jgi:hypothetical protein
MLSAISKMPSNKEILAAGGLPGSCELLLEIVSTSTNKALKAKSWGECLEHLGEVRKHLDDIDKKLKSIKNAEGAK